MLVVGRFFGRVKRNLVLHACHHRAKPRQKLGNLAQANHILGCKFLKKQKSLLHCLESKAVTHEPPQNLALTLQNTLGLMFNMI